MGKVGIVGEYGPEIIRATPAGTEVTSRIDTAMMMGRGGQVVSGEIGVTVDDDGKMQAYVKRMGVQYAQAAYAAAINDTRRNLGAWNDQYQRDGAIA